jgi:hypothetical protein
MRNDHMKKFHTILFPHPNIINIAFVLLSAIAGKRFKMDGMTDIYMNDESHNLKKRFDKTALNLPSGQ